ncbi:MAG TPA: T9SS type A sorting domain-containing protein [bacterium]
MKKIALVLLVAMIVPMLYGYKVMPGVTRGTTGTVNSGHDLPIYTPAARQNVVLFVEDWNGTFGVATHPDPNWDGVLTTLIPGEYGWFQTTASPQDGPDLATMQTYQIVIWNCYDDFWTDDALTANDQTNIADYITGGGKVWLIGQDIIYSGVQLSWLTPNFHLASYVEDYNYNIATADLLGEAEIAGWTFIATSDYVSNPFFCDDLTPDAEAHHVILDQGYSAYPSIASPNTLPLNTSFWTVDGRSPSSQADWEGMVLGMLTAFGYTGVQEKPVDVRASAFGFAPQTPGLAKGSTVISYVVIEPGRVTLDVYDGSGRHVITVIDGYQDAGVRSADLDANQLSDGVYILRLTAGEMTASHKLVVAK